METALSDNELLEHLLNPEDDKAWKVGMGLLLSNLLTQVTNQNSRMGIIEAWRWKLIGAAAAVSTVIPVLGLLLYRAVGLG